MPLKRDPREEEAEDLDELEPEDGYSIEDYEYTEDPPARRKGSLLVAVLGVLTVLCAVVLAVMLAVVLFLPNMFSSGSSRGNSSDPDALMHDSHVRVQAELKDSPAAATEPEPTEETTIPPESNPYDQYDFQYNLQNYLYCLRQDSRVGVDVSAFQHDIDWKQVKASGVEFAMLRLGYRGYGNAGNMVEDEYIQQNLKRTAEVGMPIGVYFFSQATSLNEVREEIDLMLKILGNRKLDYPIVLDWETVPGVDGRTRDVDRRLLTDMLRYFCDEVSGMGYQPMIYFNWTQAERMLYLSELEDYPFWLALYQDRMTYPFKVEMWQYSCTGTVPGIEGEVDLNIWLP